MTLLSDSINRSSIQTVWGLEKEKKKKKKESTRVGRVALGLTDVSLMFPLVLMLMGKKKKRFLRSFLRLVAAHFLLWGAEPDAAGAAAAG